MRRNRGSRPSIKLAGPGVTISPQNIYRKGYAVNPNSGYKGVGGDPSCVALKLMNNQIGDHRIKVNPEAAASIHEDGIVILHSRYGRLFTGNRTGARIWRGIERQLPFEAIADDLSREYQIAGATAREHTARFLAELERHNLIERGAES
jgi:hypothetical protein